MCWLAPLELLAALTGLTFAGLRTPALAIDVLRGFEENLARESESACIDCKKGPATIAGPKNLVAMAHCIAPPQSVPIVMALDPRI